MQPGKRHLIVATAGHIDHGKTALVRALTGMETDRLEEEKRRGITIELGFAFLGDDITIIDVPGHERFIKTMVAGVHTVDLALLVVAADDGIMPQTREHLEILHFLGVPRLFLVITKVEGQSPDWLDLVEAEIVDLIPLSLKPELKTFRCDSLSGRGIEDLRQALLKLQQELPPHRDPGVFRLAVDRAFSLKGFGAVITGTVLGGNVSVGDQLWVLPGSREVRVRGLQTHGRDKSSVSFGERAALNLTGLDIGSVHRGDWLTEPQVFLTTERLDVALQSVSEAPVIRHRERIRFHGGTAELLGRLMLLDADQLSPDEKAFGQIILENPTLAVRGDRFILRRYSPMQTLGGGVVLDPLAPPRRRSTGSAHTDLEILATATDREALVKKIHSTGWSGLSLAAARTFANLSDDGLERMIQPEKSAGAVIRLGSKQQSIFISAETLGSSQRRILQVVKEFHASQPELLGLTRMQLQSELPSEISAPLLECALEELLKADLVYEKGLWRARGHQINLGNQSAKTVQQIEAILAAAEFDPPSSETLQKQLGLSEGELIRLLSIMKMQGKVVQGPDAIIWATELLRKAWPIIYRELSAGLSKTTSQLRETLGYSRRATVSLLEYFDSVGRTERRDEVRLPGAHFHDDFN